MRVVIIGASLEDKPETANREYCDDCIKRGVEVFLDRGLDADVYARNMGVTLATLMAEYPGWPRQ
jgi:hypothetical protein